MTESLYKQLRCSDKCFDRSYRYIKSMDSVFFESFNLLNEYQKSAVVNEDKALLLNAGVGSGKTTVLVHKILYLYKVRKVSLDSMVVLTFTNKAADEIKERVLSSGSCIDRKELNYFGTFHSVARNLLSSIMPVEELGYTKDFSILDETGSKELFEGVINSNKLSIKYRDKIAKRLYDYKNGRNMYGNMKYEDEISKLAYILDEEKKKRNLMDFDDLIENCAKLLKNGYFKPEWVIIDEFQDTDGSQLEMIDGLVKSGAHVFAVGDPNQIIYSWRGSKADIFSIFKERYDAAELNLPINYRSTGTILEAARAFLCTQSKLEGIRDRGTPIIIKRHYNSFNEAVYLAEFIKRLHSEGVPYKEIAVFYRKQKQSAVFEDVFKRENIPYEVSIRKDIKDIPVLYWLFRLIRAALNTRDMESFIYAVCDKRYGTGHTPGAAAKIIRKGPDAGGTHLILISAVFGFGDWCRCIEDTEGFSLKVYNYFDMDSFLSPTSITYDEDRDFVIKYLEKLEGYIRQNGGRPYEGMKDALEYSILYGSQIIESMINKEDDSVKLMTLHASKGLEFEYVFISGANMGIIPVGSRFDDEEEKRLFFVGLTRAKDYLEISYHLNPDDYNALPNPSPYLRMIPDELIESEEIKSRAHKLSELKREIRNNMDIKAQRTTESVKHRVRHTKYGDGYVVSETDDMISAVFEGYGEKSFARMFCPLEFIDD